MNIIKPTWSHRSFRTVAHSGSRVRARLSVNAPYIPRESNGSPLVFNCGTRAGSTGHHSRRFSLFGGENEPGIGVPRFAFPADELAQKIQNQNREFEL